MLRAAPNQRVAHLLALVEQPERLEALEAPLDQLARLAFAVLLRIQPVDDEDQALVAALGARHQSVASLLDEAGLEAVDAKLGREDQRIAIVESVLVEGEGFLAEERVVLGIGVDQVAGEDAELARGHQMACGGQSRRVHEGRFRQADLARIFGHLLGEGVLGAGDAFGEDDRRVVARLDGDALDQVGHAHHGVERREHGRAARRRAAGPPRMLAHLELVVELEPAGLQLAEHDRKRHQLAHARRRHERVGILLEQHEIGVGIHQQGMLGLGLERAGRRCRITRGDGRTRRADQEDGGRGRELDPSIKTPGVHGVTTQKSSWIRGRPWLADPSANIERLGQKSNSRAPAP